MPSRLSLGHGTSKIGWVRACVRCTQSLPRAACWLRSRAASFFSFNFEVFSFPIRPRFRAQTLRKAKCCSLREMSNHLEFPTQRALGTLSATPALTRSSRRASTGIFSTSLFRIFDDVENYGALTSTLLQTGE